MNDRHLLGPLPHMLTTSTVTLGTFALNAAANVAGSVFAIRRIGENITKIGFYASAVTGTPTGTVELVSADSSSPLRPAGAAYGGSASGSATVTAGFNEISLGTPATPIAIGDLVGIRITNTSADPTATPFTVQIGYPTLSTIQFPFNVQYNGTTWTTNGTRPAIVVRYASGVVHGGYPVNATGILGANFSSATTPDEIGLKWTAPYSGNCGGMAALLDPAALTDTFTVRLYNAASTVLKSASLVAGQWTSANRGMYEEPFADQALVRGSVYRLTIQATGTGNRTIHQIPIFHADYRSAFPQSGDMQLTSRTNSVTPAAWTDSPLIIPLIAPIMTSMEAA